VFTKSEYHHNILGSKKVLFKKLFTFVFVKYAVRGLCRSVDVKISPNVNFPVRKGLRTGSDSRDTVNTATTGHA
jgi:hypothetical protein